MKELKNSDLFENNHGPGGGSSFDSDGSHGPGYGGWLPLTTLTIIMCIGVSHKVQAIICLAFTIVPMTCRIMLLPLGVACVHEEGESTTHWVRRVSEILHSSDRINADSAILTLEGNCRFEPLKLKFNQVRAVPSSIMVKYFAHAASSTSSI